MGRKPIKKISFEIKQKKYNMTTPEEINDQIEREDIQPYLNKVYDGKVPDTLVDQFRIAMMFIPPASHKYEMKLVETMSMKLPNEVTNKEIGLMINIIYAVPFASMYPTLEEGIEKTKTFDKLRIEYNRNTEAFERKVAAKRNRLMNLAGIQNSVPLKSIR